MAVEVHTSSDLESPLKTLLHVQQGTRQYALKNI